MAPDGPSILVLIPHYKPPHMAITGLYVPRSVGLYSSGTRWLGNLAKGFSLRFKVWDEYAPK